MRSVLVGVGKNYYLIVFEICLVEISAEARTQSVDDSLYLLVFEYLFYLLFLDVERLTSQRQNSLTRPVSSLLRASARAFSLNYEQFVEFGFSARAVCHLSYERRGRHTVYISRYRFSLCRAFSRFCGYLCFFENSVDSIFFSLIEIVFYTVRQKVFDKRFYFGIAQFCLGLSLELHILHLDGKHCRKSFAVVLSVEVLLFVFDDVFGSSEVVERSCQSRAETRFVRTALGSRNIVDVTEYVLGICIRMLKSQLYDKKALLFLYECGRVVLDRFTLVEVYDKVAYSARIAIIAYFRTSAFGKLTMVGKRKLYSAVKKSKFPQSL